MQQIYKMDNCNANTLAWQMKDGVVELALHHEPTIEIGAPDVGHLVPELG